MPLYEFICFIIFLFIFLFGFLYCFYREVKSNADLRKRLISHLDHSEELYTRWSSVVCQSSSSASADAGSGTIQP